MGRRSIRLRSLRLVALATATAFTLSFAAPPAARADEAPERNTLMHYGLGVGSVLCSLVYGPAKVMYATLGAITGGLAWALTGGRTDVPREIIEPAIRGDYVVTPEHLTFNQPLMFVGHERALDQPSGDQGYE
jgi:hypothetical protein